MCITLWIFIFFTVIDIIRVLFYDSKRIFKEVMIMNNLKSHLFETNAVKVCHGDKPFWYTSGKIGPYFINTHFVYGSEEDAANFLSFID